jgi:DNA-binding SARP family transcriptional activator
MARLSVNVLGSFQATLNGEPVTGFAYSKARALLAYLAVEADRPHTRRELAALLYPESTDRVASSNLRKVIYMLRRAIGNDDASPPYVQITRQTVQLDRESDFGSDLEVFTRAIEFSEAHAHRSLETCTSCMERLAGAAEVYRGDLLAGLAVDSVLYEEWLVVQRERLHGHALEMLGHLADYHGRRGEHDQAIEYARRQVELEPWRESAHRQWMRALVLSGQRAEALAQYAACRQVLEEELGVEPEEETTALYERIRRGDLPGLGAALPHNLPVQLTPFVGRDAELAEIVERLADPACRLLTLVGPGGSGKTRLALEAATRQREQYEHGAFFIPLAPLQAVEAIVPTIAREIGFSMPGGGDPLRQLLGYLRQKEMLLILDNLEHLLAPPSSPPLNGNSPPGGEKGGAGSGHRRSGDSPGRPDPGHVPGQAERGR